MGAGLSPRVGVREVAERAGTSTATVTRVFASRDQVSKELAERVLAAADELNYVPHAAARNLKQQRTRLIGLLIPDLTNPFFAEVARGVEDHCASRHHHVVIGSSDLNVERERDYIRVFMSRIVDGALIVPSGRSSDELERFLRRGLPLVYLDRVDPAVPASSVVVDNFAGAQRAIDYLIRLGHERIAVITGPTEWETARTRLEGFRQAHHDHRLALDDDLVFTGYVRRDGGREAARALLALERPPTAIFSFNNLVAVGVLEALQQGGVQVPEQMSVISFDDLDLFQLARPTVTAIRQPSYELGVAAGSELINAIEEGGGEGIQRTMSLETELIERQSCAPPP